MLVAGEDVKAISIDHLLGLPYGEWALSRDKNALPARKNMLINLLKGVRCRGVERGGDIYIYIYIYICNQSHRDHP